MATSGKYFDHNPHWKVSTTWRTTFSWDRIRLSTPMKRALRAAAETGEVDDASPSTVKALRERHLCDEDRRITPQGKVLATSTCSLRKQCEMLDLPLKQLEIQYEGGPELAVLNHLRAQGSQVCCCEGGAINTAMYCLCFDRLYRLNCAKWGGPQGARSFGYMGIMCFNDLLEDTPNLAELMLEDITVTGESDFLQAFDILKSWQGVPDWAFRTWVGVDRNMVLQIFRVLHNKGLLAIAKVFVTDPFAYSKGWPDLTVIDLGELHLVEVKTSDRLHASQIITIPAMKEAGLKVEVIQIKRPSQGCPELDS